VVRPFPRPCAKRELHALGCLYFWNSMYWMFYSIVCPALITLIYICICFLLSVWLSHSYAHHFTFVGLFLLFVIRMTCLSDIGKMCAMKEVTLFSDDLSQKKCKTRGPGMSIFHVYTQ
jgi:hypothetical protein